MSSKALQRTYTRLEAITKATVTLRAQGVSNDELATVAGRLAQVVKIKGDLITLQVFAGTEGIPTNAEVQFFGEPPTIHVSFPAVSSTPTATPSTAVRPWKAKNARSAARP